VSFTAARASIGPSDTSSDARSSWPLCRAARGRFPTVADRTGYRSERAEDRVAAQPYTPTTLPRSSVNARNVRKTPYVARFNVGSTTLGGSRRARLRITFWFRKRCGLPRTHHLYAGAETGLPSTQDPGQRLSLRPLARRFLCGCLRARTDPGNGSARTSREQQVTPLRAR
jgi:hypothetical protein